MLENMISHRVILTCVLAFHFSVLIKGQPNVGYSQCEDMRQGFFNHYYCTLQCFEEVLQLSYIRSNLCKGAVEMGSKTKEPVSLQAVGQVIECIAVRCKSAVPPSVCGGCNGFINENGASQKSQTDPVDYQSDVYPYADDYHKKANNNIKDLKEGENTEQKSVKGAETAESVTYHDTDMKSNNYDYGVDFYYDDYYYYGNYEGYYSDKGKEISDDKKISAVDSKKKSDDVTAITEDTKYEISDDSSNYFNNNNSEGDHRDKNYKDNDDLKTKSYKESDENLEIVSDFQNSYTEESIKQEDKKESSKQKSVIEKFNQESKKEESTIEKSDQDSIKEESVAGKSDQDSIKEESVAGKSDQDSIKEESVTGKSDQDSIKEERVAEKSNKESTKENVKKSNEKSIKEESVENFKESSKKEENVIKSKDESTKEENVVKESNEDSAKEDVAKLNEDLTKEENVGEKSKKDSATEDNFINKSNEDSIKEESIVKKSDEDLTKEKIITEKSNENLPKEENVEKSHEESTKEENVGRKPDQDSIKKERIVEKSNEDSTKKESIVEKSDQESVKKEIIIEKSNKDPTKKESIVEKSDQDSTKKGNVDKKANNDSTKDESDHGNSSEDSLKNTSDSSEQKNEALSSENLSDENTKDSLSEDTTEGSSSTETTEYPLQIENSDEKSSTVSESISNSKDQSESPNHENEIGKTFEASTKVASSAKDVNYISSKKENEDEYYYYYLSFDDDGGLSAVPIHKDEVNSDRNKNISVDYQSNTKNQYPHHDSNTDKNPPQPNINLNYQPTAYTGPKTFNKNDKYSGLSSGSIASGSGLGSKTNELSASNIYNKNNYQFSNNRGNYPIPNNARNSNYPNNNAQIAFQPAVPSKQQYPIGQHPKYFDMPLPPYAGSPVNAEVGPQNHPLSLPVYQNQFVPYPYGNMDNNIRGQLGNQYLKSLDIPNQGNNWSIQPQNPGLAQKTPNTLWNPNPQTQNQQVFPPNNAQFMNYGPPNLHNVINTRVPSSQVYGRWNVPPAPAVNGQSPPWNGNMLSRYQAPPWSGPMYNPPGVKNAFGMQTYQGQPLGSDKGLSFDRSNGDLKIKLPDEVIDFNPYGSFRIMQNG